MSKLSDEYYERNCYLKTDTVPTQSVMKKRMSPALANVYFKSMRPNVKVLAGLAPPLKGGGSDWFVSPDELLKGRTVMIPMKKEFLSKLGCEGISHFGGKFLADHQKRLDEFKAKKLLELDNYWKNVIDVKCRQHREEYQERIALENRKKIELAFHQFSSMYSTSLTKLEGLLHEAAINDMKRVNAEVSKYMQLRYETMLKQQATTLYDSYNEQLLKKKKKIRSQFINNLEQAQTLFGHEIHDINVEKHLAIEKLRHLLECQNLACQVYVALKEREECGKEIEALKYKHKKEVKHLTEQLALKDFEINLE